MSGVASGLYTHGPGIKRQCQNEPDGLSCPSDRRADDLKTLLDPRRSNHNSAIIQCATQPAVPALPVLSNIPQRELHAGMDRIPAKQHIIPYLFDMFPDVLIAQGRQEICGGSSEQSKDRRVRKKRKCPELAPDHVKIDQLRSCSHPRFLEACQTE